MKRIILNGKVYLKELNIDKIEINIFKKELNSYIQRLALTKEEVIRIVESLYR